MANFIPLLGIHSCEFLNLRLHLQSHPCVHCGRCETLKAHGFLRSTLQEIRGIRLYCSNRDSSKGCGRTFSVHFENYIPHVTLSPKQLRDMHGGMEYQPSDSPKAPPSNQLPHQPVPKSTVARWHRKFEFAQSLILPRLLMIHEPARDLRGNSVQRTWQSMRGAFPNAVCVITAFQRILQANLFSYRNPGNHVYQQMMTEGLNRFLTATRIGTQRFTEAMKIDSDLRIPTAQSG